MLRKLRRLSKLSICEWFVLIQLALSALVASIALRFFSIPRVTDWFSQFARNRVFAYFPIFHDRITASRLVNLADIAAWVTHRQGRCLMRSLLLFWLLRCRGEPAELLIGVHKEAGGLKSHAWITMQGTVLVDSPDMTSSFTTLLRY